MLSLRHELPCKGSVNEELNFSAERSTTGLEIEADQHASCDQRTHRFCHVTSRHQAGPDQHQGTSCARHTFEVANARLSSGDISVGDTCSPEEPLLSPWSRRYARKDLRGTGGALDGLRETSYTRSPAPQEGRSGGAVALTEEPLEVSFTPPRPSMLPTPALDSNRKGIGFNLRPESHSGYCDGSI